LSLVEDKPLNEIKKYDINISNAHQVMAWRVFMNWCFRNDLVDRNPFLGIPVVYGKRDRVLTPEEIKKIWSYEDKPFSNIIKVLILTGGRREEVFHFEQVSNGFYLPAEKAKNHTAHTIPTTELLASLMPLKRFNGWGKSKARMDKETGVKNWVLHDTRRFYATTHAHLGTPIHVVESLLNHVSGSISGVARVYNRYDYLKEAKKAVVKYEEYLQTITA
jgi:integrase